MLKTTVPNPTREWTHTNLMLYQVGALKLCYELQYSESDPIIKKKYADLILKISYEQDAAPTLEINALNEMFSATKLVAKKIKSDYQKLYLKRTLELTAAHQKAHALYMELFSLEPNLAKKRQYAKNANLMSITPFILNLSDFSQALTHCHLIIAELEASKNTLNKEAKDAPVSSKNIFSAPLNVAAPVLTDLDQESKVKNSRQCSM